MLARQVPLSTEFSRQEYWSGSSIPFSRGSSQPRDRTPVSYTASRFSYPLSHQGPLDAHKEGLGADVSKIETCSKPSPTLLEGHVGVCSEGGQGKQVLGLGRTEHRL